MVENKESSFSMLQFIDVLIQYLVLLLLSLCYYISLPFLKISVPLFYATWRTIICSLISRLFYCLYSLENLFLNLFSFCAVLCRPFLSVQQ